MLKNQRYNENRDYDNMEEDDDFEEHIEKELIIIAEENNQKSIAASQVEKPPLPLGWRQEKGKDRLVYTYDEKGTLRCGAYIASRGKYCERYPAVGRNKCRKHGGATPRGVTHHKWKDGRYTRDLSERLAARYEKAINDKELLSLRQEIAVIEARIGDLLTRVDTGESGAMWRAIKTTYTTLRKAAASNDQQAFADALNDLGRLITKGSGDYTAWDEVLRSISHRKKLVESERKRLVEMKQMITAEQAMELLGFVISVIKTNVPDKKVQATIGEQINKRLNSSTGFIVN